MSWTWLTLLFVHSSSAMAAAEGHAEPVAVVERLGHRIRVDDLQAPVVPLLSLPEEPDRRCDVRVALEGPRVVGVKSAHHCHPVFLAAVQEASTAWSIKAETHRGKAVEDTFTVRFELVERDGQIGVDTYVVGKDGYRGAAAPAGVHFMTPVQAQRQRDLVRPETLREAGRFGAIDCRAIVKVTAEGALAEVSVEHCPTEVALDMRASLAKWTWRAQTVDGVPVSGTMAVSYQLKEGAALPGRGAPVSVGTIRAPRPPEPIGGKAEPAPQGPGAR